MSKPHKLVIPKKTTKLLAFNSFVIAGALCFLSPAAYAAVSPADASPLNPVATAEAQPDTMQAKLDLLQAARTATQLSPAAQVAPVEPIATERDSYWATSQTTLDHRAAVAKKKAAEAAAKKAAKAKAAVRKAQVAAAKARIVTLLDTPASDIQAYAYQQVQAAGWSDANFTCLVRLWNKESGWNPQANNASSGAYGIPQALPGSKMASAGSDWKTNYKTQINWGLDYIASSYGTPCAAWKHSQSTNWY